MKVSGTQFDTVYVQKTCSSYYQFVEKQKSSCRLECNRKGIEKDTHRLETQRWWLFFLYFRLYSPQRTSSFLLATRQVCWSNPFFQTVTPLRAGVVAYTFSCFPKGFALCCTCNKPDERFLNFSILDCEVIFKFINPLSHMKLKLMGFRMGFSFDVLKLAHFDESNVELPRRGNLFLFFLLLFPPAPSLVHVSLSEMISIPPSVCPQLFQMWPLSG